MLYLSFFFLSFFFLSFFFLSFFFFFSIRSINCRAVSLFIYSHAFHFFSYIQAEHDSGAIPVRNTNLNQKIFHDNQSTEQFHRINSAEQEQEQKFLYMKLRWDEVICFLFYDFLLLLRHHFFLNRLLILILHLFTSIFLFLFFPPFFRLYSVFFHSFFLPFFHTLLFCLHLCTLTELKY